MTIDMIRERVLLIVKDYPIEKVILFGSRALGTNREDSDVDLIVEFRDKVSLLTLSSMKIRLEELLSLSVDLIHGPLREGDLLEVEREVVLYAAQG